MRILAFMVIYTGFLVFLNYGCLAPFFPSLLSQRELSPFFNSLVFAVFAFSYVLCSLFQSTFLIPLIGRPNALLLSVLSLIAASIILGSLKYVLNRFAFVFLAVAARLLQGLASSFTLTLGLAILSVAFPDKV